MHLATRGNNKIVRTPPPHISSSEEIHPRLTRRTLAQLRTSNSPFLKSYLHKVDAKSHPSPLFPLCNTHTHNTHHLFNCSHIHTTLSPLDVWTDPAGVTVLLARWTEKLAGGPQAGTSDSPHWQGAWEWVDNNTTTTRSHTLSEVWGSTKKLKKNWEPVRIWQKWIRSIHLNVWYFQTEWFSLDTGNLLPLIYTLWWGFRQKTGFLALSSYAPFCN